VRYRWNVLLRSPPERAAVATHGFIRRRAETIGQMRLAIQSYIQRVIELAGQIDSHGVGKASSKASNAAQASLSPSPRRAPHEAKPGRSYARQNVSSARDQKHLAKRHRSEVESRQQADMRQPRH